MLRWIPACDWCREQIAQAEAERERKRAIWAPRTCAAADCEQTFTPAKVGQRFCSDQCRKRTHWQAKAANGTLRAVS